MRRFFTFKEITDIDSGKNPCARSRKSLLYAARRYGAVVELKRTPWTDKEIEEICCNLVPYGRSLSAARNKAHKMGIPFKPFQTRG